MMTLKRNPYESDYGELTRKGKSGHVRIVIRVFRIPYSRCCGKAEPAVHIAFPLPSSYPFDPDFIIAYKMAKVVPCQIRVSQQKLVAFICSFVMASSPSGPYGLHPCIDIPLIIIHCSGWITAARRCAPRRGPRQGCQDH